MPRDAGVDEARLRGAGFPAARLAQRHEPPQRPEPAGDVAAPDHRVEGRGGDRGEGAAARAVLEPDRDRLQAQPRLQRVRVAEVRRRHRGIHEADRADQRRIGDLGMRDVVGGVGVVQPPVQQAEPVVELGLHDVDRRHGDAELAQRCHAEPDGFGHADAIGQAPHLQGRRARPFCSAAAQPLDPAVLLVGVLETTETEEGGVPRGVHAYERRGVVDVDKPQRGGHERLHHGVVADQPRLVGGAVQHRHHLTALGRILDRVDDRQVLLGGHGVQLRHGDQPPRQVQLERASPLGVEPAQDRLADPVMPEPHRDTLAGLDDQEALVEGGRERPVDLRRRRAGRDPQDADLGAPAEARHRLDDQLGLGRHRRHARRQGPGHLGPAQAHAHGSPVPAPPGGRRSQRAGAAQRVEQLDDLVRIARGVLVDRGRQIGRGSRVDAEHVGDHRHDAWRSQVLQVQVPDRRLGSPARQQRRERMRRVRLDVAVRADDEQPRDRLLAQQHVHDAQRRPPGPLQVVEEHHERPLMGRDRPEHGRRPSLRPRLRGQRISGVGRHPEQRRELRQHGAQQLDVGPFGPQDPVADLGQRGLGLGQQEPAERPERLTDPVELQIAAVQVELAGHEPAVTSGRQRPELIDQRRLADPWRAAQEQAATAAGERVLEGRLQRRHRTVAPNEPRRRQEPERKVTLAEADGRRRRAGRGVPHPLEVVDDAVRGLVPIVGLLLEQAQHDLREGRRKRRVQRRRGRGHASQ